MKRIRSVVIAILACGILLASTGCSTLDTRRVGEVATVQRGVVTSVKPVTLAGSSTGAGATLGATLGTFVGAQMGGGLRGILVGAMIGQVVGAVAGKAVEKNVTASDGIELIVKLEEGNEIAVPQPTATAAEIRVGDRVTVIQTGATAVVEKL